MPNRKMSAKGSLVCWLFQIISILLFRVNSQLNSTPSNSAVHRRFEYKYSFKPPYLAQKDGTVPFWEYGGSKYTK